VGTEGTEVNLATDRHPGFNANRLQVPIAVTFIALSMVQPIPLGVTFSKAQSSKLERLFCHVSVKRDVRAFSFEL